MLCLMAITLLVHIATPTGRLIEIEPVLNMKLNQFKKSSATVFFWSRQANHHHTVGEEKRDDLCEKFWSSVDDVK